MCQSHPELPFGGGIPIRPKISPDFVEVVVLAMEVGLMHGVVIYELCGAVLTMAFREKGVLAKMFHK